jgi:hypothetical protein
MAQFEILSLGKTIEKVETLIDSGNGDTGRLYHILESLKNNRRLYRSDQVYLENKLNSSFLVEEETLEENSLLPKIQSLIDSGNGDPGRLQHIYDMLLNHKPLYRSDELYLESKLEKIHELPVKKIEMHESNPHKSSIPKKSVPGISSEIKIERKGTMPKGWAEDKSKDLDEISKNIKNEEHKIQQQQKIDDEINLQRSNLYQLVSHRKQYEQKITQEKLQLESQIKDERIRIETQTKLSKDILLQKEELAKVQKERVNIIKKIDSEKTRIAKELLLQKKQLAQAQLEQEIIEKQVHNEQTLLTQMIDEQKSRLTEQAQIAHEIKFKQNELEKTKQDYDFIVNQVNEEKAKFTESEKLRKLIQKQEQDLIKAKEGRLHLINTISKEKEAISKKTEEEKLKLKSQKELAAQLKKEEKLYESLRKRREKIELQIKVKNQKLKQKQQMLKKQIDDKNRKLKSLSKKPSIAKSGKKSLNKKTVSVR